jgi:hypothetical protein
MSGSFFSSLCLRVSVVSTPMKNASKHAEELKGLLKKLVKDRPERPEMNPLTALVRGVLSMDADDLLVDEAITKIDTEFVDVNELRVATELEVADLIGEHHPRIDEKVTILRTALNTVFDREQVLKLDRVKELKKAEIRQYLRSDLELPPFVEAFVSLHAFDTAAFPVDDAILGYLIDEELVEDETEALEAQQFLENNIKSDDIYGSYLAVRAKALTHERKKPKVKKK